MGRVKLDKEKRGREGITRKMGLRGNHGFRNI